MTRIVFNDNIIEKIISKESLKIPMFNEFIHGLKHKGYALIEASIESDRIYVIFDAVYNFKNIPHGFEILETAFGDCSEHNYICHQFAPCNRRDIKTVLVYREESPYLSSSELKSISKDLLAWGKGIQIHRPTF